MTYLLLCFTDLVDSEKQQDAGNIWIKLMLSSFFGSVLKSILTLLAQAKLKLVRIYRRYKLQLALERRQEEMRQRRLQERRSNSESENDQ